MRLKYLTAIVIIGVCIFFLFYDKNADDNKDQVVIFQIVEHEALNMTRKGVEDYLGQCCQNLNITYENAQGNMALALQIGKKILNSNPKAIVAIGTVAAQSFLKNNKVPVIFSSVTDPIQAGLVQSIENSGKHFAGVSNTIDVALQLKLIKDILPNSQKIGFIYNPSESNSVEILAKIQSVAPKFNFEIVVAAINSSNDVFIATQTLIDKNVDAIFISNDNTALSSMAGIIKIATAAKVPVFCSDTDTINSGIIAAIGPNQYNIGVQTGKVVERIVINQEKPNNMAVEFPKDIELKINLKTATKLDMMIDNNLIDSASEVIK